MQIETKDTNGKQRIFYIDPAHISHKTFSANRISHKPPQIFSSQFGGDPHEKYHAGQPFVSDRKYNFSSSHLPFIGPSLEKFRINAKLSKVCNAAGEHKSARSYVLKSVDPGVEAVYTVVPTMASERFDLLRNKIKGKEDLYHHNINLMKKLSNEFSGIVSDVWGDERVPDVSEMLANINKQIKQREAIHLTSANKVSAFFGIASGGVPFVSGWFVGVVFGLSDTHNLTISKTEDDNIKLSFNNRHQTGATFLAGTGQGTEITLLKTTDTEYMTVLPIEANLILALQGVLKNDFSFELTQENFDKFIAQFSKEREDMGLKEFIISEADAEKMKEVEFVVKLELKAELRGQIGKTFNKELFVVLPRTAFAAKFAVNLLNAKYTSKKTVDSENNFSLASSNLKVTSLKTETGLYADWKIMPIVFQPKVDEGVWCYPIPILEESKTFLSFNTNKCVTWYEKSTENTALLNKKENPDRDYLVAKNISAAKKMPMFINVTNKGKKKKGPTLKKLAIQDKDIGLINETLTQLKKTLTNREVSSQHKSCAMSIISHYERIDGKLPDIRQVTVDSPDSIDLAAPQPPEAVTADIKAYRLKKLEFRKLSSLHKVNASLPVPMLNVSNSNDVTYDQFLGEIEFLYQENNDLAPFNTERRLAVLY